MMFQFKIEKAFILKRYLHMFMHLPHSKETSEVETKQKHFKQFQLNQVT